MTELDEHRATSTPAWLDLDDSEAREFDLSGAKAAALAEARHAGISTLPGIVITTEASRHVDETGSLPDLGPAHRVAIELAGDRALVVRSSSVAEDDAESSAAGQFESVLGVQTVEEFEEAVRRVIDSRTRADAADEAIAVLVQPMIEPDVAGVCFGVEPVTGRTDRLVIAATDGQPDRLVSGGVDGARYLVDHDGNVIDEQPADGVTLETNVISRLTDVAHELADVFGGPQDIEWAWVDGELLVLQSRPVISEIRGVPEGPVFGPGPVAETFPEHLSRLEQDLWVPPLRAAVADALRLAGAASSNDIDERELVIVVNGQAAIDLEITSEQEGDPSIWDRLSVTRRLRRLWSA